MRRRGNRARRNRVPNNMRRHTRFENQRNFRGIVAHGRSDPPRVLLNPWNQITLTTLITGATTPTPVCTAIRDLDTYFVNQTGGATGNRIYRVMEAQFWHIVPNGELNNRVRARFYSLINETTSCDIVKTLAFIDDYGTPARNATAKFIWPSTHSSNVFSATSIEVVTRLTLESSQQVLAHFKVLWKPVGGSSSLTRFNEETRTIEIVPDEVSLIDNAPLYRTRRSDDDNYEESISSSISNINIAK